MGPRRLQISPLVPTPKDDALAADVMLLRSLLLNEPVVRDRFDARHQALRSASTPRARLGYWVELDKLARDLDRAWSRGELHSRVRDWPRIVKALHLGVGDGIGLVGGRPGYGRRMDHGTVELVARSIAMHAAGRTWAACDAAVAPRGMTPQEIAIYRKRLRDRMPPAPAEQESQTRVVAPEDVPAEVRAQWELPT